MQSLDANEDERAAVSEHLALRCQRDAYAARFEILIETDAGCSIRTCWKDDDVDSGEASLNCALTAFPTSG